MNPDFTERERLLLRCALRQADEEGWFIETEDGLAWREDSPWRGSVVHPEEPQVTPEELRTLNAKPKEEQ